MKYSDTQLWQHLITHEWDLDYVCRQLQHPKTIYPGRPLLLSADQAFKRRLFDFSDRYLTIKLTDYDLRIASNRLTSIVDSTLTQLLKNLTPHQQGPVADYLRHQAEVYRHLSDKNNYGFYAFYFDRTGEFEAAVQFPPLPIFKLALTCSCSQLYQDKHYQKSWLEIRSIFNSSHVLFAGASVASLAASTLIRDGRIGYITIGDPKQPNATNFNRTAYDVFDVASQESKAIGFARHIHRQDPTQIIYLETQGFTADNFLSQLREPDIPPVQLVIEAIDSIPDKLALLRLVGQAKLPLIQVSDVGSKAQLSFKNPQDYVQGKDLIFGLPNSKLQRILTHDFIQVAAYFVGLDNSVDDEVGLFVKGKINTPFGQVTPQMGSTASVAAGIAAEKALRYLLDASDYPQFAYPRIVVDKKNNSFKTQFTPSLKARLLSLLLDYKNSTRHVSSA